MKKSILPFMLVLAALLCSVSAKAAVTIQKVQGWFESGYVTWNLEAGATYNVYYRPQGGTYVKLDDELVRKYNNYGRADMVGLKAGNYQFKVVSSTGSEAESAIFTAAPHDRSGFAHVDMPEGIGAYKNDGTLKDNARVIYVTGNNAKTVQCVVMKDKEATYTGLQAIIAAYEKGAETRPLCVRFIGTIKDTNMDAFGSSAEGLQVKGKNGTNKMNITFEGIGNDATIHGFGFLVRNARSVEFRNFAIMICMDDCLSLDTDNHNVWIHNMDFFYGGTGGDADQAKGDGTVDIKGKSSHNTVSYNHFFDSGKCSLGGMKSETTDCWMTYHHNWFDHSDSRHPRIRTAFYHIYNNYFDGNSKYGVGVTMGGSAFVEKNYFRNCKYPMLISKQGTDAQGAGTFSGETGGVIKAYDNIIINPKQLLYYDGKQTDGVWDAVKANNREDNVTATAKDGGSSYNATADAASISTVPASAQDEAKDVALICRGEFAGREGLGAGRIDGGDFKWTFNYVGQDENYGVITELKNQLLNYKSTLVGFLSGNIANETIVNGGATATINGGDGVGKNQAIDNTTPAPSWGADATEDPDFEEEPYIAGADNEMFWFGENATTTQQYITDGTIKLQPSTTATPSTPKWDPEFYTTTTTKGVTYTSEHKGAFTLPAASAAEKYDGGAIVFYCPKGVTSFSFNMMRSGKGIYKIQTSADGVTYTDATSVNSQAAGVVSKNFSRYVRNTESTDPVYVRILNGSTGSLYVFGVLINQLSTSSATLTASDLAVVDGKKNVALFNGESYTIAKGTDYTTSSTGAITFKSSNASVATVDANGKINAISEGTATITMHQDADATYKAASVQYTVNVTDKRANSALTLTSVATLAMKEGDVSTITVTGIAGKVTYTSSNNNVAYVDEYGNISAVAKGSAVITVADSGSETVKAGSVSVKVNVMENTDGAMEIYNWKNKVGTSQYVSTAAADNVGEGTIKVEGKNVNGVKFAKSITIDATTTPATIDYCMNITPVDGYEFKKGDIVRITGCYNNKSEKTSAVAFYDDKNEVAFKTTQFANTNATTVVPEEQVFEIPADTKFFNIGRAGNTSTFIIDLKVIRQAAPALLGDANNDGKVDQNDAKLVMEYYLATEKSSVSGIERKNADVNEDGTISMADANAIMNICNNK